MKHRVRTAVSVVTSVMVMASVVFAPVQAQAAEAEVWAFVYADRPTEQQLYEPVNQAGSSPSIRTEVNHFGTGVYSVYIRGASAIGVPVVTAVNDGPVHCQLARFNPTGSAEDILVHCYNGSTFTDSKFTLSFFSSSNPDSGAPGAYGYVLNDQPTLPTYSNPLHYNSTGGPVEIYLNPSNGIWTVRFFGQAFNNIGGNVQVAALGGLPMRCAVFQWYPHVLGADAQVRCDKLTTFPSFVPQWTLVYQHERSIVGGRSGSFGYLQANQPSGLSYFPSSPRNFGSDGLVHRVTPMGGGRYQVQLNGTIPLPNTLGVVVNGDTDDFCNLVGWSTGQQGMVADVRCYTETGVGADNWFSLNYYSPN